MPARARRKAAKPKVDRKLDAQLDEALDETFPASDPVAVGAVTSTEPPARPTDRKAPALDLDEVAAQRRKG